MWCLLFGYFIQFIQKHIINAWLLVQVNKTFQNILIWTFYDKDTQG